MKNVTFYTQSEMVEIPDGLFEDTLGPVRQAFNNLSSETAFGDFHIVWLKTERIMDLRRFRRGKDSLYCGLKITEEFIADQQSGPYLTEILEEAYQKILPKSDK